MKTACLDISELKRLIIHNKAIMPEAKGLMGIILFKLENKLELDEEERCLLDDMVSYLNINVL